MASLTREKLVSKLGYVAYFNEQVWSKISNTAGGNVYHATGSAVTLQKDKITNVSIDGEGKATKTGESTITIKAAPRFNSTSYVGANTRSGSVKDSRPLAIRTEHLKTINPAARQYFTLSAEDIDAKATAMGKDPSLIVADALYSSCFQIIKALISIRPFKATWSHESSESGNRINEKFNGGGYAYGIFIDTPTVNTSWTNTSGSGSWGAGGSLSRWQITLGGNISALNLTETSVARNTVYKDNIIGADQTSSMVINFWNAWANRCKERNSFDYKYFSCHLNCHSSCHNSCHGSRSRR